jgi:hypothetical protein
MPSPRPVKPSLGRGRLHADLGDADAQVLGKDRLIAAACAPDLRQLADDRDVGIGKLPAMLVDQQAAVTQELTAVGILPARFAGRKVLADVAQRQRAKQRIAERMDEHVAIGMRIDPAIERQPYATEDQMVARAERMYIETTADPHSPPRRIQDKPRLRMNSASARSAGVVTLMLSSEPSTRRGFNPRRSIAIASSVMVAPSRIAACSARVRPPRRNNWGVSARQSASRGSVMLHATVRRRA